MDELNELRKRAILECNLLRKSRWRYTDIQRFFGCGTNKAGEIRKYCSEHGGRLDFDPLSVTCRSVMAMIGTTPEIELLKRSIILYPEEALPDVKAFLEERGDE